MSFWGWAADWSESKGNTLINGGWPVGTTWSHREAGSFLGSAKLVFPLRLRAKPDNSAGNQTQGSCRSCARLSNTVSSTELLASVPLHRGPSKRQALPIRCLRQNDRNRIMRAWIQRWLAKYPLSAGRAPRGRISSCLWTLMDSIRRFRDVRAAGCPLAGSGTCFDQRGPAGFCRRLPSGLRSIIAYLLLLVVTILKPTTVFWQFAEKPCQFCRRRTKRIAVACIPNQSFTPDRLFESMLRGGGVQKPFSADC